MRLKTKASRLVQCFLPFSYLSHLLHPFLHSFSFLVRVIHLREQTQLASAFTKNKTKQRSEKGSRLQYICMRKRWIIEPLSLPRFRFFQNVVISSVAIPTNECGSSLHWLTASASASLAQTTKERNEIRNPLEIAQ